jgi:N-acetylneuraminic acid mutarotase
VGGNDQNDERLSSVERYNPVSDSWETVAPMSVARTDLSVAVSGGYLYAAGGYNDNGQLSLVERYSASTNIWSVVESMAHPRRIFGLATM